MSEEKTPEETKEIAIAPINRSIVMPAVSSAQAVEAWKEYEDLKSKILDPKTDIQKIGSNDFKKKSYWKKLQTFFNLNTEIINEQKIKGATDDPMDFVYHFIVRATAPNGRFVDAVGSCSSYEKAEWIDGLWQVEKKAWKKSSTGKSFQEGTGVFEVAQPNTEHNVRSTAYTRAANRSISDLVGGGEVSAEEADRGRHNESTDTTDEDTKPAAKTTTRAKTTAKAAPVEEPETVEGEVVDEPKGEDNDFIKSLESDDTPEDGTITDSEVTEMYELGESRGYTKAKMDDNLKKAFKADDPKELTREQYERVMNGLTSQKAK